MDKWRGLLTVIIYIFMHNTPRTHTPKIACLTASLVLDRKFFLIKELCEHTEHIYHYTLTHLLSLALQRVYPKIDRYLLCIWLI